MFGFCLATVGAMRFLVCIAWAVHTFLFGGNKMNILCKSESCIQELENWRKDKLTKSIIHTVIIDLVITVITFFLMAITPGGSKSLSKVIFFDEVAQIFFIFIIIEIVASVVFSIYYDQKNIKPEYEKFKKFCQQESVIITNDCLMITLENKNFNIGFYEIQNVSSNIVEPFDSNCFPYSLLKIQTSNNTYYFSSFKNCKVLETIILNNL